MATAKIYTVKNGNGDEVDVCARIERDESGENDFVKISTWHPDPNVGGIVFFYDILRFENKGDQFGMCEIFIDNFSEKFAEEFARSFQF